MNYGENVFQLDNPDQWYCQVRHFTYSHTMLDIQLTSPDGWFSIEFRKVRYISGATAWIGASFEAFGLDDKALDGFIAYHPLPASVLGFKNEYVLFHLAVEEHQQVIIIANAGWLSKQPYYEAESKILVSVPPLP